MLIFCIDTFALTIWWVIVVEITLRFCISEKWGQTYIDKVLQWESHCR